MSLLWFRVHVILQLPCCHRATTVPSWIMNTFTSSDRQVSRVIGGTTMQEKTRKYNKKQEWNLVTALLT